MKIAIAIAAVLAALVIPGAVTPKQACALPPVSTGVVAGSDTETDCQKTTCGPSAEEEIDIGGTHQCTRTSANSLVLSDVPEHGHSG